MPVQPVLVVLVLDRQNSLRSSPGACEASSVWLQEPFSVQRAQLGKLADTAVACREDLLWLVVRAEDPPPAPLWHEVALHVYEVLVGVHQRQEGPDCVVVVGPVGRDLVDDDDFLT